MGVDGERLVVIAWATCLRVIAPLTVYEPRLQPRFSFSSNQSHIVATTSVR
jgi:hypothetical protein